MTGRRDVTAEMISDSVAQPAQDSFWLTQEEVMTTRWVYFYGTDDGSTVKIGHADDSLTRRRRSIETSQLMPVRLLLLAAVRGTSSNEEALKAHFAAYRVTAERNNTESFYAKDELVEYVNWLRQQYFTWTSEDDGPDDLPSFPAWCPQADRRVALDKPAPGLLVQDYDVANGDLNFTPWAPMARPLPPHNDYYTPVEIVHAARQAMGDIDLDAATHWIAARAHGVTNYYHQYRSAFDNPWAGRVWLNPPYGENQRWFTEITRYWDSGGIKQLCMLSPVWAFSTAIAKPVIARSSAMLLLCPTPKFWGRHKSGRIVEEGAEELGVNHPHAILYMGPRAVEFKEAFTRYGVPMKLDGGD